MMRMSGLRRLATSATPEMKLPPPTGTMIAPTSGSWSRISQATVPAPGHQAGIVAVLEIEPALARGDGAGLVLGIGQGPADHPEVAAEEADVVGLERRRAFRHGDHRRHAEQLAGIGDALAVIAGRGGDDAPPSLLRVEQRQPVERAARLEGADRPVILVLHPQLAAMLALQQRRAIERRARIALGDEGARRQQVGRGRRRLGGHD